MDQRPFFTENASPLRAAVERRSAVVVVFLRRLPRPVPGIVVLGLVALGLLAPPLVGGLALLFAASVLAWVAYLSWPAVPPQARAVRVVVFAVVVGYALARLYSAAP